MLDVSWSELLVLIVVAVIVIGPKQLPEVLYGVGRIFRRMQYMRFALSKQFEDFMEQAELNQLKNINQTIKNPLQDDGFEEDEQLAEKKLIEADTKSTQTIQNSDPRHE